MACDGEWLVVVGCYWLLFVVIGFYWLLFLGEIGQSFGPLSPVSPFLIRHRLPMTGYTSRPLCFVESLSEGRQARFDQR